MPDPRVQVQERSSICTRHPRGSWVLADGGCYVCWCETEIKRLRQGLWDVAAAAGADTDGNETPDHLGHPDIVDYALQEVRELRETYEGDSDEAVKNMREAHEELAASRAAWHATMKQHRNRIERGDHG